METDKRTIKKENNQKGNSLFSFWVKNLGAVILVYIIILKVSALNPGYDWLINSYLKGNLQMAKENSHLTMEERMSAKMGTDFSFLLYLRDNTLSDAVILYPTKADFTHDFMGQKSPFAGQIVDKLSAVRWLYPRRVVMHEEMGKSSWTKKVTHVAIVNGQGREYLSYPVDTTYNIGVLPINPNIKQK